MKNHAPTKLLCIWCRVRLTSPLTLAAVYFRGGPYSGNTTQKCKKCAETGIDAIPITEVERCER
jgi:hypothetical protein